MSVYNSEQTIRQAIESILNQSFSDFELIIVDDGSIDRSLKITKDFIRIDKRIKLIENETNIGLTKSLNKAINLAKGKFIARQDDDDISLPKRFELQINFMENNPNYAFCGCNGIIKQNGQELLKFFEFNAIKTHLIKRNYFVHSTILIRKDILTKCGLYNEKYLYGQDYELWCRLIYKYDLKAKNLRDKLIIQNVPLERLLKKNDLKIVIQRKNSIRTKLKYLKYSRNKLKGIISIISNLIDIFYILILNRNLKKKFILLK